MTLTLVAIISLACAFLLGRASTQWTWAAPTDTSLTPDTDRKPMTAKRLVSMLFLIGWIIAWTAGICMAILMFLASVGNPGPMVFVGGWIIAAVAGWVFAANTIYRLATGKPVKSRGEEF